MRKKQLLATLVMLSLMQGSVYAAPETITQNDFTDNVYTATEDTIGSVEITSNQGEYTLNPVKASSTIIIDPTRNDHAAIFIDSENATTDLPSLTIDASVQIAGDETTPLKSTAAFISVGDTDTGGHLNITGDLTLKNIHAEDTSGTSIINVSRGVAATKTGSSFKAGNIVIENAVTTNSKGTNPVTDTSLINIGGNSSYKVNFDASDITLNNNSSDNAVYFTYADVDLGKITFKDGAYNYGIKTNSNSDSEFSTKGIKAEGTDFKTGFVYVYKADSFKLTESGIYYDGTGVVDAEPTLGGDNYFVYFNATDEVDINGNVEIKNLSWNDSVFMVNNVDKATFDDIVIKNITQNQTSASNGIEIEDVDAFTANKLDVSDITYTKGNNNHYGISISDSKVQGLTSINVEGLTYQNVSPITTSDGNGGLKITGSTFENTLDSITVKNIEQKSGENEETYYGFSFRNSSLNSKIITIENIKTNSSDGDVVGFNNWGAVGYQNLYIKDIEAGNSAQGLFITSAGTLKALTDATTSSIQIEGIHGGEAYGLKDLVRGKETITGNKIEVSNINADKTVAYGIDSGAIHQVSQIEVDGVSGVTAAYGMNLGYNAELSNNDKVSVKNISTTASGSKVVGINLDADYMKKYSLTTNEVEATNIGNKNAAESYGIYNEGRKWNGSDITVSTVEAADDGKSIGFYNYTHLDPSTLNQKSLFVSDISGGEAYGLKNYADYRKNYASSLNINQISIDGVTGTTSAYGIHNIGYSTFASEADASTLVANPADDPSLADSAWVYVHDVKATDGKAYGIYTDSEMENAYTSNLNIVDGVRGTTEAIGFNADNDVKASAISVNDVKASAGNAYGIYFNEATLRSSNENLINLAATNVNATGGDAKGFYFKGWKKSLGDTQSITAQNIHSSTGSAIGVHLDNSGFSPSTMKTTVSETVVSGVEGKTTAIGILYNGVSNKSLSVSDHAAVSGISGDDTAVAIAVEAGNADFGAVNISDVKSENGRIALVSAKDGADVSIGSGLITHEDFEDTYTPSYTGNYEENADSDKNFINSIALRSVGGSKITLGSAASTFADGDNTTADGVFTVVGDIVAGRGAENADAGSIEINGNNGTRIYGDVYAGNEGTVNITLNGEHSVLEGQIDDYHELANGTAAGTIFKNSAFYDDDGKSLLNVTEAGNVSLTLNDSKWIARGQSFVDTVTLDGGIIDMSQNENSSVTVSNLSGDGTIKMNLDSLNRENGDMLYVTGSHSGNQTIDVTWINGSEFYDIEADERIRFATTNGNSTAAFSAQTRDAGFFNLVYTTDTDEYDAEHEKTENVDYNGEDNGQGSYKPGNDFADETFKDGGINHYIVGIDDSKSEISDAGQTIINMSRANYSNAIYMDRLNKRLGEARYINGEEEQGMWVRLRHDRIGKEDAFRSQNTMYEMGYDVKQDCDNGDRRVGFAIDYMDGKTEYRNVAGDGDIKRYGLWLYDTWMGDKGHYADYVLKWGHLENNFDIYNSRGKVNGDYSNNVFSVSAEYGKKNDMGNDWYFEPQAQLQLARVTGADYVTSQNTKVSLDGINSLIGRAGFRLGKDMGERSTVYVKADVLHEFFGDQTISALDTTTNGTYRETFENKGTWYDVGFGFATALGKDSYAFMDFEKSFGNDNDETYQINAGVQWTF